MNVVVVREAIPQELPVAADYWNAMVKEAFNDDWHRKYPNWRSMFLSIVEKRMSVGLQKYYVAETTMDGIVGVAGAQVGEAFFGAVRGYVDGVYVLPAYRRQGIASQLMRECIRWLQSMACDVVRLQATTAGKPLYESLGFTPTDEMELTLNARKQSFAERYGVR